MTTSLSVHSVKNTTLITLLSGLLAVLLAVLSLPGHAFDLNDVMKNNKTPYSATQTATVNNKQSFSMDVFWEKRKLRMNINEGDQEMSMIMLLDEETNYMLMHELSMYQEVNSKRANKQFQNSATMQFTNQQELGTEEANGFMCTKYTADFADEAGNTGNGTYWVNSDNIVVRAVMTTKRRRKTTETTMDLTNVQVGDQPDELFEVPANYQSLGLGGLFRQSRNNNSNASQDPDTTAQSDEAPPEDAPEEGRGKNVRKALKGIFGRGN